MCYKGNKKEEERKEAWKIKTEIRKVFSKDETK